VRVHACGLNPADWALCRGLFAGNLPRGIGLDVSGTINAVGEGVEDAALGDEVLGPADFAGAPVAGASDFAILGKKAGQYTQTRVLEEVGTVHANTSFGEFAGPVHTT